MSKISLNKIKLQLVIQLKKSKALFIVILYKINPKKILPILLSIYRNINLKKKYFILTYFLNRNERLLWGILSILILLIIFNSLWFKDTPDPEEPINIDLIIDSILIQKNVSSESLENTISHNSLLIANLKEFLIMDTNMRAARDTNKTQSRLFYVAILVGLITILFTKVNRKNSIKYILLILIILMYLLEVHNNFLNKRSIKSFNLKKEACIKITKISPNDNIWFDFDFTKLEEKLYPKNEYILSKKINYTLRPDPEQIVFFIVPLILLSLYGLVYKKINPTSELFLRFSSSVRESTIKRLIKVPEGYENWKISKGALSFAQVAQHIIDLDYWTLEKIKNPSIKSVETENVEDLVCSREGFNNLISKLKESLEVKLKFIEALTEEDLERKIYDDRFGGEVSIAWIILRGNLDHEIHHRGQIAAYLRALQDSLSIKE